MLAGVNPLVPCLKKIWADGAYSGEELAGWREQRGGWKRKIVERDREAEGFERVPKRWIVERIFSWLIRNRHLSKDYERMVQTSETLITRPIPSPVRSSCERVPTRRTSLPRFVFGSSPSSGCRRRPGG